MKITCSNREENIYIDKFRDMIGLDIVENMEIVEVISESVCNTCF